MNNPEILQLQLSIIQAVESNPLGQDLETIHTLLNRPRRDFKVLPQVGALVSGGFIEKVQISTIDSSNTSSAGVRRRPSSSNSIIKFRLTPSGQRMLETARQQTPELVIRPAGMPEDEETVNVADGHQE